mmetsp:Transcript_1996/g.2838  ORF Transcript_1996/g.2838 Transcript_1996/m.2838 type:complete len:854 (-) Transcript_1996:164-2725(-)
MSSLDVNLHSDKGLILMHLRILQMVTENLNQMMSRAKASHESFAENLTSHVQNLLWFASLSVSELKVDMVHYIRKKFSGSLTLTPSGEESVFKYDDIKEEKRDEKSGSSSSPGGQSGARPWRGRSGSDSRTAPPVPIRNPHPTPKPRIDTRVVSHEKPKLHSAPPRVELNSIPPPPSHSPPPPETSVSRKKKTGRKKTYRSMSLVVGSKLKESLSVPQDFFRSRTRSATSFDSNVVPQGADRRAEAFGYESTSLRMRRGRDHHRRLSMGGGGGMTEMGKFQVKFNIYFKQIRNQSNKRRELVDFTRNHCSFVLRAPELPFQNMLHKFIEDTKSGGTEKRWGKSLVEEKEDTKKRTLREQLLQVSEFVATLATTIWSMHKTLESQRKPGPMRELFLPICKKAIWAIVLKELQSTIFEWYRFVYHQASIDLLNYWERIQKEVESSSSDIRQDCRKLKKKLEPLINILKSERMESTSLAEKMEALSSLIRTVPLMVSSRGRASADSLLSILAFCILSAAKGEVCAHIHFLADMVMLVHQEEALGELGCSVTSLICAAQYSSGLDSSGYAELVGSLIEELDSDSLQVSAEQSDEDRQSSMSEPSRDSGIWSFISPPPSESKRKSEGDFDKERSKSNTADSVDTKMRFWQGENSDLIAICQHAVKSIGKRSTSNRCILTGATLVRHLYRRKICSSREDAIQLGRSLEAHGIIRPYRAERRSKDEKETGQKPPPLPKKPVPKPPKKSSKRSNDIKMLIRSKKQPSFDSNSNIWEVAGRFGDLRHTGGTFEYSEQTLAGMWNKRKALENSTEDSASSPSSDKNISCPSLLSTNSKKSPKKKSGSSSKSPTKRRSIFGRRI